MNKKYFSNPWYYFIIFTIVSILYIVNGYASFATNDDWALKNMLAAKGIYGTLIMSYPLSYLMSHLYDYFPTIQWYSSLITLIMGINFYLVSLYIAHRDSLLEKIILLILALLWMTFLWFTMSITVLTVTTMVIAVGLIPYNIRVSFLLIFIASLLRTDTMLMMLPYYTVSYFALKERLSLDKKELLSFILLIILVSSSLYIQKQDKPYNEWLAFNKARSAIVDTGSMNVKKDYFTPVEFFCTQAAWFQDPELLPTDKMIATNSSLIDFSLNTLTRTNFIHFINKHKFKYWFWLLLFSSLLVLILNIKNRRSLSTIFLVIGVFLLLLVRDVDRVTVPLMVLWAYVIFENLKSYQKISIFFIFGFTALYYYYLSPQLQYRYFNEITAAKKEAHKLIKENNKVCEVSLNYPTTGSEAFISTIFLYNYIFHENNWLKMDEKEILPTGWLSRHPTFYQMHNMSDTYTKRKYNTYYEYLIDDNTAFIGGRILVNHEGFNKYLLATYDTLYLKDKPHCKHKTFIIAESEHFALSQIRVDCNITK